MKLPSLPSWLTRQATTSAEHAERVEEARRDMASLLEAKSVAQAEYDAIPCTKTEDALLAADDATRRGQVRLDSAERALKAAKAAEDGKARAALLKRKAELEAALSITALAEIRRSGVEAMTRAVLETVEVQSRRAELEQELFEQNNELVRVCEQLGEQSVSRNVLGTAPEGFAVAAALADHLTKLDGEDPMRPFILQFIDMFGGIPRTWVPPGHSTRHAAE